MNSYKLHFVGIGGVGMCGLAELLHNFGAEVTGSDLGKNANTERLESLGISCFTGHNSDYLAEDVDVLVYSSAVSKSNPELLKAKALGIPVIPRAEILSEIMNLKRGIAIAGTHGKTTTTSLIGSMLYELGLKPTIVVGGKLGLNKSTAMSGEGEWLVAEADESDGSFLKLNPEVVVITNIDYDHMDYYKTEENLIRSFSDFALKAPFYGLCIACGDDEKLRMALADYPKRVITYGFDKSNDFYILKKASQKYQVFQGEEELVELQVALPGKHNALNSLAALLVAKHLGTDLVAAAKAISNFGGVGRRMEYVSEEHGITRYDDYAHHPTELRASLQAIREKFPNKKIVGVFQPHRYSRTQLCWDEFMTCFSDLDRVFVTNIYAASEESIPGISGELFCKNLQHSDKHFLNNDKTNISLPLDQISDMDVLITLGAGNIYSLKVIP